MEDEQTYADVVIITGIGMEVASSGQAIKEEVENLGFTCWHTIDQQIGSGNIIKSIVHGIINAQLIIIDITGLEPDTLYELGAAHTLRDCVLLLFSDDSEKLPMVLHSYKHIQYQNSFEGLRKLKKELKHTIDARAEWSSRPNNPIHDALPPSWLTALRDRSHFEQASDEQQGQKELLEAIEQRMQALQNNLVHVLDQKLGATESTIDTSMFEERIVDLKDQTENLRAQLQEAIFRHNRAEGYLWRLRDERDEMLRQLRIATYVAETEFNLARATTDHAELVFVPAALIVTGTPRITRAAHDRAQRFVRSFYLDKYPVTNQQFEQFVRETGYITVAEQTGKPDTWRHPAGSGSEIVDNHPVVCVYRKDAQAYAEWAGRRLPTVLEWERAMRGVAGLKWPWGNEWREGVCNLAGAYSITTPVSQYPNGVSPVGCWDMVGNAWEWMADELPEGRLVLMGGSWVEQRDTMTAGYKRRVTPGDGTDYDIGFRCAMDVPTDDLFPPATLPE